MPGGIATDWGNHHMDIAHWGMDQELTGPTSVEGTGMFPNEKEPEYAKHPDRFYNTPDRFSVKMEYPCGVPLLFQCVQKDRDGIMFIGSEGGCTSIAAGCTASRRRSWRRIRCQITPGASAPAAHRDDSTHAHMENFFACVRTRNEPVAPVEIEHRTSTACHLANISMRLKRKIAWDPAKEEIVGDDEANACLKREQRAPWFVKA